MILSHREPERHAWAIVGQQTVGGRLSRNSVPGRAEFQVATPGQFASEIEAAGQFGTVGVNDVRASMFSLNGRYMFDGRLEPSVFATMDFASGDKEPEGTTRPSTLNTAQG